MPFDLLGSISTGTPTAPPSAGSNPTPSPGSGFNLLNSISTGQPTPVAPPPVIVPAHNQGSMQNGKLVFSTVPEIRQDPTQTISAPDTSNQTLDQKASGETGNFGTDLKSAIDTPTTTLGEKAGNITDTLLTSGKLPTGLNWARNVVKAGYDTVKGTIGNTVSKSDDLLNTLLKGQVIDPSTSKPTATPATPKERIVAIGQLGLAIGFMHPGLVQMSAELNMAGKLPGPLGFGFTKVNDAFKSIGTAGSFIADKGLDSIPGVSQQDKETFRPLVENLGAFILQFVTMHLAHTAISTGGEGILDKTGISDEAKTKIKTGVQVGAGLAVQPFSTAFGLANGMIINKIAQRSANNVKITSEEFGRIVNEVKSQLPQQIESEMSQENKNSLADIAKKHLSGYQGAPQQTAPIDVTNKLTDEGYSKQDISRIVNDLYQQNPKGDFTQEQIDRAKQNYIPKGKDATTVISDLSEKGYTPEEQNTILKNLHQKSPDGNFMKADVNNETQAIKGEDLYKSEGAKAAEASDKEIAKAKADQEKVTAKIKVAQDAETKAKSDHQTAINNSEQAKGKIEDAQKDYEKSQKDQVASQKRLQDTNTREKNARVVLEEMKAKVVEAQSREVKDPKEIARAKVHAANAKIEATRAKVDFENAREEAKNTAAKTKLLQAELQKAKIELTKAEAVRVKAEESHSKAQENTKNASKMSVDNLVSHEGAPDLKTVAQYKADIQAGKDIEPLKVIDEGNGKFGVEDGKHRLEAYKQLGIKEVPVEDVTKPTGNESKSNPLLEIKPVKIQNDTKINELKTQIGQLQKVVDDSPLKDLAKYESKQYPGTLPEVTGIRGGNLFAQTGDQLMQEVATKLGIPEDQVPKAYEDYAKASGKLRDLKTELKNVKGESFKDYTPEDLQKINKIAQEATQSVSDIKQRSEGNKVGKSTGEINTKLAENGFQSLPEDEQAKYNSSTKEEQINKVTELFNDKENFKSISLGDAPLPEGVKGPVVWNTARAVAYKDGDFEWFSRLATSPLGSDISESASSLSFSRFGKSEDQAEVATAARIKEATDAVKAGNPKGDAQKESIIKETTDQIKQEADKQTLEDFLKENNC